MSFAKRIHSSGRAVVWSGHKEPAEHYWEQLKALGLTMAPARPRVRLVGSGACCWDHERRESGRRLLAGRLIVFALLSSFYFPRRSPDFPGKPARPLRRSWRCCSSPARWPGWSSSRASGGGARGGGCGDGRGADRRGAGDDRDETTGTAPAESQGDPAAGKAVFTSAGCDELPHARGCGRDGERRAEPGRGEAGPRPRRRAGHERQGRDALVQGAAGREADPGRRRIRRRSPRGLAHPRIPCRSPGEVSERPKERDWKSRTRRKAFRGFKSRPLR